VAAALNTGGAAQNPVPERAGRATPAEAEQDFTVTLKVEGDYAQTVDFGLPGGPPLLIDG
jgi:hypothetical protein